MTGQTKSATRGTRRSASRKEALRRRVGSTPKLAVLYGQREIRRRVRQLALQTNRDFAGTTLHLVGILERSFVFIADLVRQLEVPVVCHYLRVIVEAESLEGVPLRQISYSPTSGLSGKDVVLVNVILHTDITLDYVRGHILAQNPGSLRVAALVEKTDAKKADVAADYLDLKREVTWSVMAWDHRMGNTGICLGSPRCLEAIGEAAFTPPCSAAQAERTGVLMHLMDRGR